MVDLSILIPSRNEMFLHNTIEDILLHMEGDTEIIAVLDGEWADPQIRDHPKVILVHYSESIGQRAATNVAARISQARYVMKVDAHCAFDQGFDVKLLADMQDNWTMAPTMRNLHIFDWVCPNNHRRYQGPSGPCKECGEPTVMEIVWIPKPSPQSSSYCFDSEPHFQYFNEYSKRHEGRGELTESMSLQGSCFLMTRRRYFDIEPCDEEFGSWGSQGIEVACKSWLSGGKVMINHKTWYAHCFRTQGGDFGFPYPLSGKQVEHAKQYARDLFFNNKWQKQIYPLSWLVKKFWPVRGWTDEDLSKLDHSSIPMKPEVPVVIKNIPTKGIVYYTDNRLDPIIMTACQRLLKKSAEGLPIASVSLQPLEFGANIVLPLERGYLTMFKQILAGLEALQADVIFFAEHDVLYHPSHFEFMPPDQKVFYYNHNNWKVRYEDGQALYYTCEQTLGLCAYRELLIEHYRKRVERVAAEGFHRNMGFEPGKHQYPRGVDNYGWNWWDSPFPNIDIRHTQNLTSSRWRQDQFRNKKNCQNWQMADEIPFWGRTKGRFMEILEAV